MSLSAKFDIKRTGGCQCVVRVLNFLRVERNKNAGGKELYSMIEEWEEQRRKYRLRILMINIFHTGEKREREREIEREREREWKRERERESERDWEREREREI